MAESNFQRGVQVQASVAHRSRGWRNECFRLDRGWGVCCTSCCSMQKFRKLFLPSASGPTTYLSVSADDLSPPVPKMLLQQTSPFTRWIRELLWGCRSGIPGPWAMTQAAPSGDFCLCPTRGAQGVWDPPTSDAFSSRYFLPI